MASGYQPPGHGLGAFRRTLRPEGARLSLQAAPHRALGSHLGRLPTLCGQTVFVQNPEFGRGWGSARRGSKRVLGAAGRAGCGWCAAISPGSGGVVQWNPGSPRCGTFSEAKVSDGRPASAPLPTQAATHSPRPGLPQLFLCLRLGPGAACGGSWSRGAVQPLRPQASGRRHPRTGGQARRTHLSTVGLALCSVSS